MPFIRSADGITTDFGAPVSNYVGVGSQVFIGAPVYPGQFVGNVPFGTGALGNSNYSVVITGTYGGSKTNAATNAMQGGQHSAGSQFKWFKFYLMQ